jgi:hypothetical protein
MALLAELSKLSTGKKPNQTAASTGKRTTTTAVFTRKGRLLSF